MVRGLRHAAIALDSGERARAAPRLVRAGAHARGATLCRDLCVRHSRRKARGDCVGGQDGARLARGRSL
eukprot:6199655-Pleurochrysis_carterae.AAC.3